MSPYRTPGPVTPSADALALDDLRCYCGCRIKAHTVDKKTSAVACKGCRRCDRFRVDNESHAQFLIRRLRDADP